MTESMSNNAADFVNSSKYNDKRLTGTVLINLE